MFAGRAVGLIGNLTALEAGCRYVDADLNRAFRYELRQMLALRSPPEVFVGFLARESEGNPFFVGEYLRTAVAEEVLSRHDGRWQVLEHSEEEATEAVYEPSIVSV